jgi:hypothetical protein
MVFTKLYSPAPQQKNLLNEEELLIQQGSLFFAHLQKNIEENLFFLKQRKEDAETLFFKHVFLQKGIIKDKEDSGEKREIAYLFLQTAGAPGVLIQRFPRSKSLVLHYATKVRTVLKNDLNELVSPEMFVLKSDTVEEFCFLDDSYVRTKGNDKTLSVEQMTETLLLLIASRST